MLLNLGYKIFFEYVSVSPGHYGACHRAIACIRFEKERSNNDCGREFTPDFNLLSEVESLGRYEDFSCLKSDSYGY